jgi:hypothetical protein
MSLANAAESPLAWLLLLPPPPPLVVPAGPVVPAMIPRALARATFGASAVAATDSVPEFDPSTPAAVPEKR